MFAVINAIAAAAELLLFKLPLFTVAHVGRLVPPSPSSISAGFPSSCPTHGVEVGAVKMKVIFMCFCAKINSVTRSCVCVRRCCLVAASRNTLKYDDVYSQSGATNTTVYCGGIQSDLTGQLLSVFHLGLLQACVHPAI